jgi:DNA-binding transcriptional MerR regulator
MENTEVPEKLYYSISEVAQMLKVNASLIRFWEKEFVSYIKPKKSRNGKRMFTATDIENLRQIYHLTKEKGFTLAGARNILSGRKNVVEKDAYLSQTLTKLKSFLTDLKEEINK